MHKFGLQLPQVLFAADGTAGGGGGGASPSSPAPGGASSAPPSSPSAAEPSGAPSATPAPSEASPSAEPASGDHGVPSVPSSDAGAFQFPDDFDADEGDIGEIAPVPKAATPPSDAEAQPPAEAKPEVPPAPAAQPPQEQPKPAATPTAQPTPGPQEASPPPTPAEPQRVAEELLRSQDEILNHLASGEFALSKEDLEALEADASGHIPKLLARVYFKANVNFMQQMARSVPLMVERQMKVLKTTMENEQKFYAKWPDLGSHKDLVNRYAQIYRQANPQATMEQMIEEVGPMVMVAAKVQPKPQTPATVQGANGVRPPPSTPFKPASGGPAAPPQQAEVDIWAGMGQPSADEEG